MVGDLPGHELSGQMFETSNIIWMYAHFTVSPLSSSRRSRWISASPDGLVIPISE